MHAEKLPRLCDDTALEPTPDSGETKDGGVHLHVVRADNRHPVLKQLGIKSLRALGRTVFVVTLPPEQKTDSGMLFLPPTQVNFDDGPAHLRNVQAEVVAAGPKCCVKPGDRVTFQRLNFAWLNKLPDNCRFGWIDEAQVLWIVE